MALNIDLVNGLFGFIAGLMIFNNCRLLVRQKRVSGVSVLSTAFFFVYGLWNLYYYPMLGQTLSYFAGILITIANLIWVSLMIKYKQSSDGTMRIHKNESAIDQMATGFMRGDALTNKEYQKAFANEWRGEVNE